MTRLLFFFLPRHGGMQSGRRQPVALRFEALLLGGLLLAPALPAQGRHRADDAASDGQRATVIHTANLYVSADSADPPVATIAPGRELLINQTNGDWVSVFANLDTPDEDPDKAPEFKDPHTVQQPSSGWIRAKGVVGPKTPNGDEILFGVAADLESQAAQPHGPADAAPSAELLYRRMWEFFPESPLAPAAEFRAADIRWQLEKNDNSTLPSAHEQDPMLRPQLFEGDLKRVIKNYPQSPQAARAAFDLLDNRVCGDWQGLPKCPEMESNLYLHYADHYPGGPKTTEALYDAAYRQGALVTMYAVDNDTRRADAAAKNCQAIADRMLKEDPQSDYTARAESIAYRVREGIPVYGSDRQ